MNIHKCFLIQIAIAVGASLLLSSTANGEVWRSQQLNCEITLPSGGGWTSVPSTVPAIKVAVRNPAELKAIVLVVSDAPRDGQTLTTFLPGFINGVLKKGLSTDVSEDRLTIDGRAAFSLGQTVSLKGTKMRIVNNIVIDHGTVYIIEASSPSTNPLDDPELNTTLKSFHFLSATPPPSLRSPTHDPLNRLPGLIGHITFCVLVGIAVIGVIIKVTFQPKTKS
jgi:hypothetical protein